MYFYSHYIYTVLQCDNNRLTLRADSQRRGKHRPDAREVLSSLLTAWRLLYSGLGYRELPFSHAQARQLHLAAPDKSRLEMLYAAYCYHNHPLSGVKDYTYAQLSSWCLRGLQYKGGRIIESAQTGQRTHALMSPPLSSQDKQKCEAELAMLLQDLQISPLEDTDPPSSLISLQVADPGLVYFLRSGMAWEYADEFECPHCFSNAAYQELERKTGSETLSASTHNERWLKIDIRTCQCALCGGKWTEDHSRVYTEVNY